MNLAVELARSGEGLKSGPIGFAVILVLAVASYFLFKSMSKHLKKVREEFPVDGAPAAPPVPSAAPDSPPTEGAPADRAQADGAAADGSTSSAS